MYVIPRKKTNAGSGHCAKRQQARVRDRQGGESISFGSCTLLILLLFFLYMCCS
jgi:hypothetical protein